MENQHRKIVGYRELSKAEIDVINEIKSQAARVGVLCESLRNPEASGLIDPDSGGADIVPDQRWVAIGITQLQQGFMALTRAVAKPDFF